MTDLFFSPPITAWVDTLYGPLSAAEYHLCRGRSDLALVLLRDYLAIPLPLPDRVGDYCAQEGKKVLVKVFTRMVMLKRLPTALVRALL
jgi:hypothetical protein